MRATRSLAALVLSPVLVLAVPVAAQASGGGGGGGGGGGNPPPGSPVVTLSPASLAFPAELTGVTSPPQTVTGEGTGTGPTPLTIATPGMPCTAGVCDPTGGSPQITGNFWAAPFS